MQNLTDEEIIEIIRTGDKQASGEAMDYLISRYKRVVKLRAKQYYLIGAEADDVIQEGTIGLYKAIRDYDRYKSDNFKAFADLCITRQILTAVKHASRKKHFPLNKYISFSRISNSENDAEDTLDRIPDASQPNPEKIIIDLEIRQKFQQDIDKSLSKLESRVLSYYLHGLSYNEIALCTSKDKKAIDNAIQRIRRKIEKIVSNDENFYQFPGKSLD